MSGDAPHRHMLNLIAGGIPASLEFCRRLGDHRAGGSPAARMCRASSRTPVFFANPAVHGGQVDQRGGEGQRDRDRAQQELVAEQADLPQRRVVGPDGERRADLAGDDAQPGDRRGLPAIAAAVSPLSRSAPPPPVRPGRSPAACAGHSSPATPPANRRLHQIAAAGALARGLRSRQITKEYRTACQPGSPPARARRRGEGHVPACPPPLPVRHVLVIRSIRRHSRH